MTPRNRLFLVRTGIVVFLLFGLAMAAAQIVSLKNEVANPSLQPESARR